MLSADTVAGDFSREAVSMMNRIAETVPRIAWLERWGVAGLDRLLN